MRIRDLKRLIENMDEETLVFFYDVTKGRTCPINSSHLSPPREGERWASLTLSNRLPARHT